MVRGGDDGGTAVQRPVEFPAFVGLEQDPLKIHIAVDPEASDRDSQEEVSDHGPMGYRREDNTKSHRPPFRLASPY